MANTAWSATDKTAGVTLSGSNLIATASAVGNQGARAVDRQVTGKFYWEVTCSNFTGAMAVGVANAGWGLSIATTAASVGAFLIVSGGGAANYNGAVFGPALGSIATSSLLCFALDLSAHANPQIWARLGATGQWNAVSSADPAAGNGGFPLIDICGGGVMPIYPCVGFQNAATTGAWTANFGDSAFSGAVPSGFTAGFPPATGPGDPSYNSTVLLYHFDSADGSTSFIDNSFIAANGTGSGATATTAQFKFGTASANFSGAGLISSGAPASSFNFGSGQFTVECWARTTGALSATAYVMMSQLASGNFGWRFELLGPSTLRFLYSLDGTTALAVAGTFTPTPNTWTFYAADRDASGTIRVYANGVVIASASVPGTIFASTAAGIIGNDATTGQPWTGQIDDARITKGVGRYGGAFTPPTAPFLNALTIPVTIPTSLIVPGVVRETLLSTIGTLRLSGAVREVLRTTGTGAGTSIYVDGVVREMLRTAAGTGLVWFENFDEYPSNAPLPSPWASVSNTNAVTAQEFSFPNSAAISTAGNASTAVRALGSNVGPRWYADFWVFNLGFQSSGGIKFTNPTGDNGFFLELTSSSATTGVLNLPSTVAFTTTLSTGVWHHFLLEVFQAASGTVKLTMDGTVVGTYAGNTLGSSGQNFISTVQLIGTTIGPSPPAIYYVDNLGIYSGVVASHNANPVVFVVN